MLDKLADDTVPGLKAFLAYRISDGEDPTACLQMFLSFLKANRAKHTQFLDSHKDRDLPFLREIASRVDLSFFAPLRGVNQIASPDDFIAAYHYLVERLMEIDPHMPYRKDYEIRKGRIDKERRHIDDALLREKVDKTKAVDTEYGRLLSDRRRNQKESRSGSYIFRGTLISFGLAVAFLTLSALIATPISEGRQVSVIVVAAIIGAFVGLLRAGFSGGWGRAKVSAVTGFMIGGCTGAVAAFALIPYARHLAVTSAGLGIALLIAYLAKTARIQLTPEERTAYNASLSSIEDYVSPKREYEITEATLRILAGDDG